MVNLPWLEDENYGGTAAPGDYQSLAGMLPFLKLPKKQAAYYQPFNQTVGAMADINSPQFQNIYNQQKQSGQQNLAESIAEMVRQNRKQTRLGRTALFSPERGSETLFRGINKGYQDIQNQAFDQTYSRLGQMANQQRLQAADMSKLAHNKTAVKSNLLGMLTKLFGL